MNRGVAACSAGSLSSAGRGLGYAILGTRAWKIFRSSFGKSYRRRENCPPAAILINKAAKPGPPPAKVRSQASLPHPRTTGLALAGFVTSCHSGPRRHPGPEPLGGFVDLRRGSSYLHVDFAFALVDQREVLGGGLQPLGTSLDRPQRSWFRQSLEQALNEGMILT